MIVRRAKITDVDALIELDHIASDHSRRADFIAEAVVENGVIHNLDGGDPELVYFKDTARKSA